jgi:hypothetical protein
MLNENMIAEEEHTPGKIPLIQQFIMGSTRMGRRT